MVKFMSVKRMNEVREFALESAKGLAVEGFEFLGRSSEGLVFENVSSEEYFVVKVIVKKEGFEAMEAIEEYEEKLEVAKEKALKAEEKKAKSVSKKSKEKEEKE